MPPSAADQVISVMVLVRISHRSVKIDKKQEQVADDLLDL